MSSKYFILLISLLLATLVVACQPDQPIAEEPAVATTVALTETNTPVPSATPTETSTATVVPTETSTATPVPPTATPTETSTPTPTPLPPIRQLTTGTCCTSIYWSNDSTEVRFIDQPTTNDPVGIWGIDISRLNSQPELVSGQLGRHSPNSDYIAYPNRDRGVAIVERIADGETWEIDTQGGDLTFTPTGQILWTIFDREVEWQARETQIWIADVDGSNARLVTTLNRGSPVTWLSDTELLISNRIRPNEDILLSTLNVEDGVITEMVQLPRTRGGVFSPDKRYLTYLVRETARTGRNGLWLVDLQDPNFESQRLPFFGAYRWRSEETLVYLPFDPEAPEHIFYEYNLATGESRQLWPNDDSDGEVVIANNDWQISPDGSKIALVAADGADLDGIWLIELGSE
ncbi:MAG: hypothetical protein AAF485_09620 [Chloroflexota bacterium]